MFKAINLFLVEKFIPPQEETATGNTRTSYGYLEGWISIILNLFLFVIKLISGLWVNSVSLIADAFHTLSDILTSFAIIIGFKMAKKPGDKEHPFGHGRAELIATFIVSVLLLLVGYEFLKGSIHKLIDPQPLHYNGIVFGVMIFSAAAKEWLYRFSLFLGKEIDSKALIADAWHHRSDAIASLLIGVALLATLFGFNRVDALLGIAVSIMIMLTGFEIIKDAASEIIGQAPPEEFVEEIRSLALCVDGVKNIHDIEVHQYGAQKYVNVHIEVEPNLSVQQSHDIADIVGENLNNSLNISSLIHIDPFQEEEKEQPV